MQKITDCDITTTRTDLDGEIINTSIPFQSLAGVDGNTWKLQQAPCSSLTNGIIQHAASTQDFIYEKFKDNQIHDFTCL